MKKTFYTLLFLMTAAVWTSQGQNTTSLADIRPPELLNLTYGQGDRVTDLEKKGRELIGQCAEAHGWIAGSSKVISAAYVDDWSVAPEPLRVYNNWPDEKQELQHDFLSFQLGNSRALLKNGPLKGEVWGVDGNVPYKVIDGALQEVDDPNMIPALAGKEYFIQLPYWIQKVPILVYVKDMVVGDKTYHLVFGTWKSFEANSEFDQYLYWINSETKLLEIVQYTIRVVDPSAVGYVVFDDFREVQGVVIPFVHRLGYLPTQEGLIHEMRFESIVLDLKELSEDAIRVLNQNK